MLQLSKPGDNKSDPEPRYSGDAMPLVDMPIEQLLKYQGTNPRPDDFDAYWDSALAELDSADLNVRLIPHPMTLKNAEAFELRFTGVGGAEVVARYLRPKGAKNCPCILQFHGYSWYSGEWSEKLNWVSEGFAVAALDCRGQGGDSEDSGRYPGMTLRGQIVRGLEGDPKGLYFRNQYLDTAALARIVANFEEVDGTRLGATGASQGGGLTLACGALAPIKRLAPVYPFLCDFQRVWEMDLAKDAYEDIRYYLKFRDPRHQSVKEIFTKLGYIDLQFLAPRIKGEVKLFAGLMDTITPPSTYFAAYNKMTCSKSVEIYPDFGHEGLIGAGDLIWEFLNGI